MHTLKRQSIMTTPAFCNQLSWIIWKAHNLVEFAFKCCMEVAEIIFGPASACKNNDCSFKLF